MGKLAVILSLCTVAAVGIVYLFTDSLILSLLVFIAGVYLAFYLDKKWRLDEAQQTLVQADAKEKQKIMKDLNQLKDYKYYATIQNNWAMTSAIDNIYDVSYHILHDDKIDLKYINQVGLYVPRIKKILDAYLMKGTDAEFKEQAQEFMVRTSEVFGRMLTASGSSDRKEAESIMQALDDTYRLHGHIERKEGGDLV